MPQLFGGIGAGQTAYRCSVVLIEGAEKQGPGCATNQNKGLAADTEALQCVEGSHGYTGGDTPAERTQKAVQLVRQVFRTPYPFF